MANAQQLTCPNCGAPLNVESPKQNFIDCPYCHQQVVNEFAQQIVDKESTSYILPFSHSIEEHMEKFVNLLIEKMEKKEIERYRWWEMNNDEPLIKPKIDFKEGVLPAHDLFDNISSIIIKKYYIPAYLYEGSFSAKWTAMNYGRYISGESIGDFSVIGISDKEMSDNQLDIEYLNKVKISPSSLIKVEDSQIEKESLLLPSTDSTTVWKEQGIISAKKYGGDVSDDNSPGYLEGCTVSCELKEHYLVYLPIFKIIYKYKGVDYCYTSYSDQISSISIPEGNPKFGPSNFEIKRMQEYIHNEDVASNGCFYGCLGSIILFFIGVFSSPIVGNRYLFYFSIVLIIVYYIVKKINRNKLEDTQYNIEKRDYKNFDDNKKQFIESGKEFLKFEKWRNLLSSDDDPL